MGLKEQNKLVNDYIDLINGKDIGGSNYNSFFRALYFSSVTITTLGYGDIVPLTTMTRIAVGAEALIGIFLMGLFVWACTRPKSRVSYT